MRAALRRRRRAPPPPRRLVRQGHGRWASSSPGGIGSQGNRRSGVVNGRSGVNVRSGAQCGGPRADRRFLRRLLEFEPPRRDLPAPVQDQADQERVDGARYPDPRPLPRPLERVRPDGSGRPTGEPGPGSGVVDDEALRVDLRDAIGAPQVVDTAAEPRRLVARVRGAAPPQLSCDASRPLDAAFSQNEVDIAVKACAGDGVDELGEVEPLEEERLDPRFAPCGEEGRDLPLEPLTPGEGGSPIPRTKSRIALRTGSCAAVAWVPVALTAVTMARVAPALAPLAPVGRRALTERPRRRAPRSPVG